MNTDPISDMLSRIRNAIAVNKNEIIMPHSNAKETVARILVKSGFLQRVEVSGKGIDKCLEISIFPEGKNSTITAINRLSKPGRRVYVKTSDIPTVKRGRGIVVLSTSSGVMTGDEAKSKRLGGELICEVY
jgi:small subunit ribosomal protein S8